MSTRLEGKETKETKETKVDTEYENTLAKIRQTNAKNPLRPTGFVQFDIYNIIFDYFSVWRKLKITDTRIKTAEEFSKTLYDGVIHISAHDDLHNENVRIVIISDKSEIPTSAGAFETFISSIKAPTKIMMITQYPFTAFVLKKAKALNVEHRLKRYNYDVFKMIIPLASGAGTHSIMDEKELAKELDYLGIEKSAIKIIFENDAQNIWLGAKPGQVIQIRRNQPLTGESVDYRIVKATSLY